jgi:protein-tyrosine phosphatase
MTSIPPFTVLQVCMGNICRSPMAERLLSTTVDRLGGAGQVYVHSVGTGGWHAGEAMDPAAARQVLARGGTVEGFRARQLRGEHLDSADLILTATEEQVEFIRELRPDAAERTFVIGEFGRLLTPRPDIEDVYARGVAIVAAADRSRDGVRPDDELDDPWGRPDRAFAAVADQIEATVTRLAEALLTEQQQLPQVERPDSPAMGRGVEP